MFSFNKMWCVRSWGRFHSPLSSCRNMHFLACFLSSTCYLGDNNLVMVRDMVRLQAPVPTWAMDPYRSTQVPASKEMEGGKSKREGYMNQSFITAVSLYHQYSISPLQRKWPFDKTLEKCLLILLFSFWIWNSIKEQVNECTSGWISH